MSATKTSIPTPAFVRVSKHRLDALTNGLFAIVMTLLVLEPKVPELPKSAAVPEIGRALASSPGSCPSAHPIYAVAGLRLPFGFAGFPLAVLPFN